MKLLKNIQIETSTNYAMGAIDPVVGGAYNENVTARRLRDGSSASEAGLVGRPEMLLPAYIIDELLRKERERKRQEELRIEMWDPELYPADELSDDSEPRRNVEVDFVVDC